jgi:stage IV sporulation protein FB
MKWTFRLGQVAGIALFVWIGAAQEAAAVEMRSALGGLTVAAVMRTDFGTLAPDDSLERASEMTVRQSQHDFPVASAGAIAGVLTQGDLLRALSSEPQAKVGAVMHRGIEPVDASERIDEVLTRLETAGCPALPVVSAGRLVGLVSTDSIVEYLQVHRPTGWRHRVGRDDVGLPPPVHRPLR